MIMLTKLCEPHFHGYHQYFLPNHIITTQYPSFITYSHHQHLISITYHPIAYKISRAIHAQASASARA